MHMKLVHNGGLSSVQFCQLTDHSENRNISFLNWLCVLKQAGPSENRPPRYFSVFWNSGSGGVSEQPVHTEGVRAFPEQLTRRTTRLTQQPGGYTSDPPQSPCQATKFVIAVEQKVEKQFLKDMAFLAVLSIQWLQWSDIFIWLDTKMSKCVI